jgi:penicillin-insensitive murein endopeptidase
MRVVPELHSRLRRSRVGHHTKRIGWLIGALLGLGCSVRAEPAPLAAPKAAAQTTPTPAAVSGEKPAIGAKSESSGASPPTTETRHVVSDASPAPPEAGVVASTDAVPSMADILALAGSSSTSVGGPSTGRVLGAVAFPDRGPGFYHNPKRPYEARFGSVELVQTIVRAAAIVETELPGSVLVVNDLGLQEGGPIAQHGSHQAGRDADILFFSLDARGKPLPSVGVPFDPLGKGTDYKDLSVRDDDQPVQIDLPRTWRFTAALMETAPKSLQRIFIVEHLRSMLLEQAHRSHAPANLISRFEDITCQPEAPHDDHMHIRLYCTPEDMGQGCLDSPPIYPWRTQALRELGLTPLLASMKRSPEERNARAARTTTAAEARKKAGKMHPDVIKFLAERQAWIRPPHTGRPYCK